MQATNPERRQVPMGWMRALLPVLRMGYVDEGGGCGHNMLWFRAADRVLPDA